MSSVNGGTKRRLERKGRRRWRTQDSVWGSKAKVGPRCVSWQFEKWIKSNLIRIKLDHSRQCFGQVSFNCSLLIFVWNRKCCGPCEVPTSDLMGGREGVVHETGRLQGWLLMSRINETLLQMHRPWYHYKLANNPSFTINCWPYIKMVPLGLNICFRILQLGLGFRNSSTAGLYTDHRKFDYALEDSLHMSVHPT